MEAKEGVVLDAEGRTLYSPRAQQSRPDGASMQFRVYRGGWWLPIALGLGIPVLLVAGIFVFTVLLTLGIALVFVRSFFGMGRPLRSR
jgi:hypothetical protein